MNLNPHLERAYSLCAYEIPECCFMRVKLSAAVTAEGFLLGVFAVVDAQLATSAGGEQRPVFNF